MYNLSLCTEYLYDHAACGGYIVDGLKKLRNYCVMSCKVWRFLEFSVRNGRSRGVGHVSSVQNLRGMGGL